MIYAQYRAAYSFDLAWNFGRNPEFPTAGNFEQRTRQTTEHFIRKEGSEQNEIGVDENCYDNYKSHV